MSPRVALVDIHSVLSETFIAEIGSKLNKIKILLYGHKPLIFIASTTLFIASSVLAFLIFTLNSL
jgi:hypothetical protein